MATYESRVYKNPYVSIGSFRVTKYSTLLIRLPHNGRTRSIHVSQFRAFNTSISIADNRGEVYSFHYSNTDYKNLGYCTILSANYAEDPYQSPTQSIREYWEKDFELFGDVPTRTKTSFDDPATLLLD